MAQNLQMIRAVRLLNAVALGTTSGAQMQTLLADSDRAAAFNALLNRPGQMRRMAASSTAMAAVAASSTAMAALKGSAALPLSSIPAMTSASAPSGAASASSEYAGYPAYKAFDQSGSHWDTSSANMTNQWLRYSFPTPRFVHTIELTPGSEGGPTKWRLEYSDDGSTWVPVLSVPSYTPVHNVKTTHDVIAAGKHTHWRIFAETATSYCSVNEMQLLGFQ